ncbi:hypothetical protein B0H12DRAFT_1073828 [Mycena haematopus]|nr:hypothetical protein B0H12DRAFT_1073828 [Mycena haematopus]
MAGETVQRTVALAVTTQPKRIYKPTDFLAMLSRRVSETKKPSCIFFSAFSDLSEMPPRTPADEDREGTSHRGVSSENIPTQHPLEDKLIVAAYCGTDPQEDDGEAMSQELDQSPRPVAFTSAMHLVVGGVEQDVLPTSLTIATPGVQWTGIVVQLLVQLFLHAMPLVVVVVEAEAVPFSTRCSLPPIPTWRASLSEVPTVMRYSSTCPVQ